MQTFVLRCTFLLSWYKRKDTKRKNQGCIFSPTLFLRFAKGARTRFAQTIAPFYATLRAFAWRRKNEAAAVTVEQWGICSFFRLYVVHICFLYDSYIWFPYILFLYDSLVWLIYALLYQVFPLLYLMKGLCPFRFRLFLYDKSLFLVYSCAYVIIFHFHAEWLPGLIYVA